MTGLEHTNLNELEKAFIKYREKYGSGEIDLDKFETVLRSLRKKRRKK